MTEFNHQEDDFPWEQYMQEELAIFEAQQQINRTNTTTTDDDDGDNVRPPDAVIRETLMGGPSFVSNRTIINDSLTNEQIIEEKKRKDEEETRLRMEDIKKRIEEHWINISEKLKPIIDLSMRLRLDDKMRLMCIAVENLIKKYLDKKSKFLYLNNEDYELFYQFIHIIYPIDNSGRKKISDELYEFVQIHFRLE